VALADYATTELGARRVSIVFGDFGAIADGAGYAHTVLAARGAEVQLVPHPILETDLTSPLSVVAASDPDAVIVLTADTGCRAAFGAVGAVGIDVPVLYTGACAAPNIVAGADPAVTDGALFNVEGPVSPREPQPDFALYTRILGDYAPDINPIGAPTVTFRSFMNLYAVLAGLANGPGGADDIDAGAVAGSLAAQRDTPSFMGHPYTCDREQMEGLPSVCSPQQIVAQLADGELVQRTGWVDVGAIYDRSR
jgi:branched-chain amino acid transport system substrate-binding protein